jgi:hypothetical protein
LFSLQGVQAIEPNSRSISLNLVHGVSSGPVSSTLLPFGECDSRSEGQSPFINGKNTAGQLRETNSVI